MGAAAAALLLLLPRLLLPVKLTGKQAAARQQNSCFSSCFATACAGSF